MFSLGRALAGSLGASRFLCREVTPQRDIHLCAEEKMTFFATKAAQSRLLCAHLLIWLAQFPCHRAHPSKYDTPSQQERCYRQCCSTARFPYWASATLPLLKTEFCRRHNARLSDRASRFPQGVSISSYRKRPTIGPMLGNATAALNGRNRSEPAVTARLPARHISPRTRPCRRAPDSPPGRRNCRARCGPGRRRAAGRSRRYRLRSSRRSAGRR